uniref:BPTI/Kunitz inhibitor domain-containing protein n=1 Tax=Sinocyclocheilus anshuiensis TaxID=1608454 RepID=A0A671KSJ3_9TELE
MSRWYYSQQTKKCMRFWYSGCGGNENRFLTEDECFRECVSTGKFTKLCYSLIFSSPSSPNICQLKLDAGTCSNFSVKWYYDVSSGQCVRFWYGGCDGNSNRFNTQKDCEIRCLRARKNSESIYVLLAASAFMIIFSSRLSKDRPRSGLSKPLTFLGDVSH